MSIIGDAFLAIRPDSSGFEGELQGDMGKVGRNVAKVGAAVGAAAVGAAAVGVKAFADFDQAMTNSVAIMGDVSDTMRNDMEAAARDVAKTTTFSADQAAESYFFLASAGLDAAQSIEALPRVAAFAQAGAFDMARATDLATDAQSALGLASDDAAENLEGLTRTTDVFVRANELANTSVEQVSEAITQQAGNAMRNLNMDMEEGVAVLAAFADQGIKGSQAGTAFAATMEGLTRNARTNADEFDRLGIAVFDADGSMRNTADIVGDLEGALGGMSVEQQRAELAALGFNRQALNGIQALMGNSDALREYEEELREAGGTVDRVAEKQLDTFWAQLGLLKDNLMDVALTIGEALVPHLMSMVDAIKDNMPAIESFVENGIRVIADVITGTVVPAIQTVIAIVGRLIDWWNNLSPAVQQVVKVVGAVVAGLVLLAPIIAKVIAAVKIAIVIFKAVGAAIALVASPIGLVIAAVAALAYVIYRNWESIREWTGAAWDWIVDKVSSAWEWIVDAATAAWQPIKAAWDAIVDAATAAVDWFMDHVAPIFVAWGELVTAVFDRVVGTVRDAWEWFRSLWEGDGSPVMDAIRDAFAFLREHVELVWSAITAAVEVAWDTIVAVWDAIGEPLLAVVSAAWESFRDLVGLVWDAIVTIVETALAVVAGIIEAVTAAINGDWTAAWEAIRGVLSTVWEAMRSLVETAAETIRGVVDRMMEAVKRLWDRAWESVKRVLSRAWDSIKTAVRQGVDDVVEWFTGLPRRILDTVSNFGSLLKGAGRALLRGLTDGIKSMAMAPVNAVRDVAGNMRNLLPFSPAKEGPLSGSGSPDRAGATIARMIGDGIASDADVAVRAVEALTRDVSRAADGARLSGGRTTPVAVQPRTAAQAAQQAATSQGISVGTVNVYATDPKRAGDEVLRTLRERAYLAAPLRRS